MMITQKLYPSRKLHLEQEHIAYLSCQHLQHTATCKTENGICIRTLQATTLQDEEGTCITQQKTIWNRETVFLTTTELHI